MYKTLFYSWGPARIVTFHHAHTLPHPPCSCTIYLGAGYAFLRGARFGRSFQCGLSYILQLELPSRKRGIIGLECAWHIICMVSWGRWNGLIPFIGISLSYGQITYTLEWQILIHICLGIAVS